MTLDELNIQEYGVITEVRGTGALRQRLLDMGITPHTRVRLKRIAPFGDPITIELRGYELTIRRADGKNIMIESSCPAASRREREEAVR